MTDKQIGTDCGFSSDVQIVLGETGKRSWLCPVPETVNELCEGVHCGIPCNGISFFTYVPKTLEAAGECLK
jgi:hypothetical protein